MRRRQAGSNASQSSDQIDCFSDPNGCPQTILDPKRSPSQSFSQLILDRYGFIQSVNNSTRIPSHNHRQQQQQQQQPSTNDNQHCGDSSHEEQSHQWWGDPSESSGTKTIDSLSSMLDINVLHRHESKWIEMFKNWPDFMDKRFQKVKSRCRKGIPPSVRGCAWRHLSGAVVLEDENPGYYFELVKSDKGDPKVLAEIQKDLHRSFPNHELFYDDGVINPTSSSSSLPRGQSDLFDLLKAYSLHNPCVGYCQALAPVASVLLMHLPAHQAFWVLVATCQYYLEGYYNPDLSALKTDADILDKLLEKFAFKLHHLLHETGTEPVLFATEWFLCIFSRSLPWASVLRIWDAFFCEGVKILFKVAFIWIRLSLDPKFRLKMRSIKKYNVKAQYTISHSRQISTDNFLNVGEMKPSSFDSVFTSCEQQADILSKIKSGPIQNLNAEDLMHQLSKLPISDHDLYDVHKSVFQKTKKSKGV
ncbi:hypothetical protein ACOME3_009825 [Neoechinorhynchus agilis]